MNARLQNAKLNCQVLEHWLSPKDFFRVQSISFKSCKSSVLSSGHCLHWFHPAVLPAYPQNLHHRGSLVHSSHNRKHCVSSPQNWRSWYWESQTGQNSPVWEHKHNQFLYLQWEECTLGPISVVIHHLPSNPSHSLPFLFTRESAARGRYHPQEHFKSSNQFSCKGSAPMWHIRALVPITYVFYPFTEQPGCSINCLLHREGTHGAGTGREHTQCPAHASSASAPDNALS